MDVRCEKCQTKYALDDARVSDAGVPMRCTRCGHVFTVKKAVAVRTSNLPRAPLVPPASGSSGLPSVPTMGDKREWKLRQASGKIVTFSELTSLHKWILGRKVTREDEISLTGETWKKLGQIPELASFFMLAGEADRPQQPPMPGSTSAISSLGAVPSIAPVRPASLSASVPPSIAAIPSVPPLRPSNGASNGVSNGISNGASNGALHGAIPAIAPMRVPPPPAPRAPEPPRPTAPEPRPTPQLISDTISEFPSDESLELEALASERPPRVPRQRWRVLFFACTTLAATAALVYVYSRKPVPVVPEEAAAPIAKVAPPQAKPAEPSPVVVAAAPGGEGSAQAIGDATASDKASPSAAAEASTSDKGSDTAVAEAPTEEKKGSDATAAETTLSDKSSQAIAEPNVTDEGTASTGGTKKTAEAVRRIKKESRKARSSARRAETSGPKDFDWYMNEGDRLRKRQRPRAAIDAYTAAADREPTRVDPIAGKGLAHLDLGQTQQAEAAFREALRLNPRYAVAVMGLAETYRKMGKNAQAIDQYQLYLRMLPNGSEARVEKAAIERLKN